MPLLALRCTGCDAPLDAPGSGPVSTCRFCGTSHVVAWEGAPKPRTKTVHVVSIQRVGPSNRARIADLLRTVARLASEEAASLVAQAPCAVAAWDDESAATALRDALAEAGVVADVTAREVAVHAPVVQPDLAVLLDAIGPSKIAVLKVVREHLDLGMAEAKSLVEGAPCVLTLAMEGGRASAFVAALRDAGAACRSTP